MFQCKTHIIVESINVMIYETDGRKIKESRKYSMEQDHKEALKEEVYEESNEE